MSQATEPREAEGVAEERAQQTLTKSVGTTLAPRSKPSNWYLPTNRYPR